MSDSGGGVINGATQVSISGSNLEVVPSVGLELRKVVICKSNRVAAGGSPSGGNYHEKPVQSERRVFINVQSKYGSVHLNELNPRCQSPNIIDICSRYKRVR